MWRFNPRARDGRELVQTLLQMRLFGFNPRARDGREKRVAKDAGATIVSIHAPVMDAKSSQGQNKASIEFQSTRP